LQQLLGNAFAYLTLKTSSSLRIKNLLSRILLSAAHAILDVYSNLGQVIPFGRSLKENHKNLYSILLPGVPFLEESVNEATAAAHHKKFAPEKLYAYTSKTDSQKVTNIPALVGFLCKLLSMEKSIKLAIPTRKQTTKEKTKGSSAPLLDSNGNLNVRKDLPKVGIDDFLLRFYKGFASKVVDLTQVIVDLLSDPKLVQDWLSDESLNFTDAANDGVSLSLEDWRESNEKVSKRMGTAGHFQ